MRRFGWMRTFKISIEYRMDVPPPITPSITFNDGKQTIKIKKEGDLEAIELSIDDCIEFKNINTDMDTTAKITGFVNRYDKAEGIYIELWNNVTKQWKESSYNGPTQMIGLAHPYTGDRNNQGDWRTISKLGECPKQVGGRRKRTKKNRRNRRRSRRN